MANVIFQLAFYLFMGAHHHIALSNFNFGALRQLYYCIIPNMTHITLGICHKTLLIILTMVPKLY